MDAPEHIARLIFVVGVIAMGALAMAASWLATWVGERRRTRRIAEGSRPAVAPAATPLAASVVSAPQTTLDRTRNAA